jgi:dTDP-4-dehydrorhamnose reductase
MQAAIIGGTGQLGCDLLASLGSAGIALGHDAIEITDASSIDAALSAVTPTFVVNLAAYNHVDRAETETQAAFSVNADGARNVAAWCEAAGVPLLHVSTDYVFGLDRSRSVPYVESDAPGPVNRYGESKLAGERAVQETCGRHFIVRTCGLYGHAALREGGKGNFVETMLRLSELHEVLRVVDDQHCTPTATADLAAALAKLMESDAWGVYHATNEGETTWCRLARAVFEKAGRSTRVEPITTEEFGAAADRPRYSVLSNAKLAETIGTRLPHWSDAIERFLAERPEELA